MLSLRIGKRTLGSVAVRAAALHSEAAKAAAETGSFKDQMIFKPRCKGTRTPSAAAVELSNRLKNEMRTPPFATGSTRKAVRAPFASAQPSTQPLPGGEENTWQSRTHQMILKRFG